jgi:hypothetical protein
MMRIGIPLISRSLHTRRIGKKKTPLRMQGHSRGFEGGNELLRMVDEPKTQKPSQKEVQ